MNSTDKDKRFHPPIDFDQVRRMISEKNFQLHFSSLSRSNLFLKLETLARAPAAFSNVGSLFFGAFTGLEDLIAQLKASQHLDQYQCWSIDDVQECHKELGIIDGYRCENSSLMQAIHSLVRYNNETMNFWTHFIPTLYFIWYFVSINLEKSLFSDSYYYPLIFYMMTSCAYPLVSCIAHAFSCLSVRATHICFFMDYGTLSIYSWGAAMLYYNYSLPLSMLSSTYANIYLPVAAIMAVVTTIMACLSRFVSPSSTSNKALRISSFFIPYIWISLPVIYRITHCYPHDISCGPASLHYSRQFLSVALASFFYGSHIPERFYPGSFDFIGHSHNLLHIFGVIATHEQWTGGLIDMQAREGTMNALHSNTSLFWVKWISPMLILINIFIILFFAARLRTKDEKKDR